MKTSEVFVTIDRVFKYVAMARIVITGAEAAIQRLLSIAKSATLENRKELSEGEINVLVVARNQAIASAEKALTELRAQAAEIGIPSTDPDDLDMDVDPSDGTDSNLDL